MADFLTDAEIEAFRQKLLARVRELEQGSAQSHDSRTTVELDQQMVGRLSRMDALQQQQMALAVERRRKQERQRIEAALKRIDEGSFGECLRCGEAIARKRLELDATIALCLQCASETG